MSEYVVCFDLDDTLYKEKDFVKSAFNEVAAYIACVSRKNEEAIRELMQSSFERGEQVFQKTNEILGIEVPMDVFLKIYREHYPDIQLAQNVLATLSILKEKGFILGLITDGRSRTQRNKIAALELKRFFRNDNIIVSEEFGSEKPSERNYRYFMDKYPSARFAYVGDNPKKDFVTPNRLGWTTICLLDNGENIHQQDFLEEKCYHSSFMVKDIKDIVDILI